MRTLLAIASLLTACAAGDPAPQHVIRCWSGDALLYEGRSTRLEFTGGPVRFIDDEHRRIIITNAACIIRPVKERSL